MKSLPLLLAGAGLLAPSAVAQLEPVQADGGRVVLDFFESKLDMLGLEVALLTETAEVGDDMQEAMDGELHGFTVNASDLLVLRNRAEEFQPYGVLGGSLFVDGGFVLTSPSTGGAVDFMGFEIAAREVRNDGPGGEQDPDYFFMRGPDSAEDDFKLCYVKVFFSPDDGYDPDGGSGAGHHQQPDRLRIKAWDLLLTDALAAKLGRPELAGENIGYGKIDLDVSDYQGHWQHPDGQNVYTPYGGPDDGSFSGGTFKDVKLGILSSLNFQGHVGTFGSGRTGMSMSTTSCNVGDVNVPWLAAMQEDHPGIAMQLYRELNGRFEQVGVSWIKHGFFALSSSQCTPCQNPSPGTFLGVGCSDTYGTGNNADRTWLGPRDEWNVFAGTWTCLGSFFDGIPVDCERDQGGSGFGPVNHRLEAFDVDLANPGADYFYEAFYVLRDDDNLDNDIGSRRAVIGINGQGTNFTFSTPSSATNPLIEGPAVLRWGDVQTIAGLGDDDGQVVLCATATDIGGGQWRYEYALFNWNLDRKVDSFSVPASGPVSDLYFHDIDAHVSNDWATTTGGKNLTWTFPGVFESGHKVAGPLEFGTLYNFGFTSSHPPALRDATLGIHEAGNGGDLLGVETLGPDILTMGASKLAPAVGDTIDLEVRGGTASALIAMLAVNGITLPSPIILPAVPFVGGEVDIPVSIPASAAGASIDWIAADYGPPVMQLSNVSTMIVQ